jgi:RHH-type proline utilization regulon transcriptional repressor/proline dehydrogenase/delta 1-pyrroline-5-carboxylate dehydrogenase
MPAETPPLPDSAPDPRDRLPFPYADEAAAAAQVAALAAEAIDWPAAAAVARPWVEAVRAQPAPFWALESLLREYPISSAEGRALMRLAEALLRVPDIETAIALTADQLGRADFEAGPANGPGAAPNRLLAGIAAHAIELSKRFLGDADAPAGTLQRLGARTVVAATLRAIQLLGRQFVLGRTIEEALAQGQAQRRDHPGLRFSFDMLGEGARTERDAQRHLAAYARAIEAIAAGRIAESPQAADGISIKLSALFARYEVGQRARVFAELLPRAATLADAAARANLNLTVDAEESDRLELSLDLFEALAQRVAREHPGWGGFGLAVQAYQPRALAVIDELAAIARRAPCDGGLRLMVRLVKGAYWDGEVKRAQELGLPGYPVFTRKRHTDLSYLACARALLDHHERLYPQFATHNAGTIAALLQMAARRGARFELQRLHGMGEGVAREVLARPPAGHPPPALRVYAPVGEHRDLLAYLVRRLLENGANSSFVHQLTDTGVSVDTLLRSPWLPDATQPAEGPALPLPRDLYGPQRRNAAGVDLACAAMRAPIEHAIAHLHLTPVAESVTADAAAAMAHLHAGWPDWDATPLELRAAILKRAADRLEHELPHWCALLVREAHKTQADAVAEAREAIDFCRYYAHEATLQLADRDLPGPTGEHNRLRLRGRGVFVCISPWNFPLAIFAGQVVAALVAGNAVAAKPAEQTPRVAQRFVALLHACGVPAGALAMLHGAGETVGAALVADPRTAGVCFTGSTAVARHIHRSLAAREGPIVPLIAETGGLNAMIVDSTALPEQVVDAVIQSAFRSAGQRCSALRLLCLHESIADGVLEMLAGAMRELRLGDPARLHTDVGPLIDAEAQAAVSRHVARLHREALERVRTPFAADQAEVANLVAPVVFEIGRIADLRDEIFGPVLQVVRWGGDVRRVVDEINALGYGLTLGIQTRIDRRAQAIADAARVGNVYVNRNMIGAVVGVQPFGGEGLSGTGPKAGGPHYLPRFCAEQTVTVNTAAAGGNADLLAGTTGQVQPV